MAGESSAGNPAIDPVAAATYERMYQQLKQELVAQMAQPAGTIAPPASSSAVGTFKPIPPDIFDNTKKTYTVEDFLFQLDAYFTLSRVSDSVSRITFTSTRLSGAPLMWYRTTMPTQLSWEAFRSAFQDEFIPINAVRDARDQLARISQDGSVRNYLSRFRFLCMRIPNISEDEKLDRFLRGLESKLRMECELRGCTTVDEAAKVAERVYSTLRGGRSQTLPARPYNTGPAPMELGALRTSPAPGRSMSPSARDKGRLQVLQTNGRRLTDDDRDFLKRIGACLFCRRMGHFKDACPLNRKSGHPNGQKGSSR